MPSHKPVSVFVKKPPSKMKKMEKKVHKLVKLQELKVKGFGSVSQASTACTTAFPGNEYPLSVVGQGSDVTNRIGDKIQVKKIHISWRFECGPGTTPSLVRLFAIQDMGNNGASPSAILAPNTYYETAAGTSPQSIPISQFMLALKNNPSGRFRLLYDSGPLTIGPLITAATQAYVYQPTRVIYKTIRCKKPTIYQSGANNITACSSGAIFMYSMSDNANVNENGLVWTDFVDA